MPLQIETYVFRIEIINSLSIQSFFAMLLDIYKIDSFPVSTTNNLV